MTSLIIIPLAGLCTHLLCDACIVYTSVYKKQNFKCVFSIMNFFKIKVMFRYHFLGHVLAEFNLICCGSLLDSILKTYRRKFL